MSVMRIHYLQHVPFEGIANIGRWAKERIYPVTGTALYKEHVLPEPDGFDFLVVMGGPMGVYDEKKYPWLLEEKKFIEKAIKANKIVLGICLGAQLIADVLGAKVYKNKYKEIGWYPVILTEDAKSSKVFSRFKDRFIAFHWHSDTFDIPSEAKRIAETEACKNQAFEYKERVFGLQFHLESTHESIRLLAENCTCELIKDKYIQTKKELLLNHAFLKNIEKSMTMFLNSANDLLEFKTGLPR